MPAMTRGPLPARVYWVRRLLVLGIALLLVLGIARLLGGGSDATSEPDAATPAAADVTSTASTSPTSAVTPPASSAGGQGPGGAEASSEPVLAAPEGTCDSDDIAVTPKVDGAVAGRDVTVVLQLRTLESEACTWRVSHDSLTLAITSGKDDIWSSRDCPKAIPVRDVVVRRAVTTNVAITWRSARRSDEYCSLRTEWAMPGWYHVIASALGGEPSDLQFELGTPTSATVTKTVQPSPNGGRAGGHAQANGAQAPASSGTGGRPIASPSGAVEPD